MSREAITCVHCQKTVPRGVALFVKRDGDRVFGFHEKCLKPCLRKRKKEKQNDSCDPPKSG